jgi:hypothetical protein
VDCKRVDQELIAFHLAALDGATRAAVEAHLCACGRCIGAYLMLKRAVDGGEDSPAPGEATRARVFAAAREALAGAATAGAANANASAATASAATASAATVGPVPAAMGADTAGGARVGDGRVARPGDGAPASSTRRPETRSPARRPGRTLVWATAAAAMLVAAPLIYRATAPQPPAGAGADAPAVNAAPAFPGAAPLGSSTVDTARAMPESLKYL